MLLPDPPSRLRQLVLAPAALLYTAASAAHRAMHRIGRRARKRTDGDTLRTPLIVVGSLRAGGAGKTGVALELARHLQARGLRVGILAYDISGRTPRSAPARRILPDTDWRAASDEAVMLARATAACAEPGGKHTPAPEVFVTRDRARARAALDDTKRFDVFVSDDGLMDARLTARADVFRIALVRPRELETGPRWHDLLPAGPYRLTAAALRTVDYVAREDHDFVRTPVPPRDGLPTEPCWLLCGVGNPRALEDALRRTGLRLAGTSAGPDHGVPALQEARRRATQAGADLFVCTEKDRIKLESHPHRPQRLLVFGESVTFSEEFIRAIDRFLARQLRRLHPI